MQQIWQNSDKKLPFNKFNKDVGLKLTSMWTIYFILTTKLFAKNDNRLDQKLKLIKIFSDDIQMEFGPDKCWKKVLE